MVPTRKQLLARRNRMALKWGGWCGLAFGSVSMVSTWVGLGEFLPGLCAFAFLGVVGFLTDAKTALNTVPAGAIDEALIDHRTREYRTPDSADFSFLQDDSAADDQPDPPRPAVEWLAVRRDRSTPGRI